MLKPLLRSIPLSKPLGGALSCKMILIRVLLFLLICSSKWADTLLLPFCAWAFPVKVNENISAAKVSQDIKVERFVVFIMMSSKLRKNWCRQKSSALASNSIGMPEILRTYKSLILLELIAFTEESSVWRGKSESVRMIEVTVILHYAPCAGMVSVYGGFRGPVQFWLIHSVICIVAE